VLAFRDQLYSRAGFAVLLALAVLAPLYALFGLLTCALVLDDRPGGRHELRTILRAGAVILVVALFNAYLPTVIFHLGTFSKEGGSSIAFRSGLDGSDRYFSNIIDAMMNPYGAARKAHALHMPMLATLCLSAIHLLVRDGRLTSRMARLWLICLSPYLFNVVFFPQAVAIHPYIFDVFLTASSGFVLAFWSSDPALMERLRGNLLLIWFFACAGVIMTNLIDIGRAWRAVLP